MWRSTDAKPRRSKPKRLKNLALHCKLPRRSRVGRPPSFQMVGSARRSGPKLQARSAVCEERANANALPKQWRLRRKSGASTAIRPYLPTFPRPPANPAILSKDPFSGSTRCKTPFSTPCPPCSLTRSLPLINVDSFAPAHLAPEGLPSALSRAATLAAWVPFGPTFGCSSSKAPQPFRLWLNSLYSPPAGLFVDVFDLFVAFFHFFLCVLGRRPYRKF